MIDTIVLVCDSTGRVGLTPQNTRPTEQARSMQTPLGVSASLVHPALAYLEPADSTPVPLRADWLYIDGTSSAIASLTFYDRSGAVVAGPCELGSGQTIRGLGAYSVAVTGIVKTGTLIINYGIGDIGRESVGSQLTYGTLQSVIITDAVPGPLADTQYVTPVISSRDQVGYSGDITSVQGTAFYGVNTAHWDHLRLVLGVVDAAGNLKYKKSFVNCRVAAAVGVSVTPTLLTNPTRINTSDVLYWEYERTAAGVTAGATFPPGFVMELCGYRIFTRYSNVYGN